MLLFSSSVPLLQCENSCTNKVAAKIGLYKGENALEISLRWQIHS